MTKIVDYIQNYKASNPTGWRKWIIGFLVFVLTILVIAMFAFQATRRGRELARLYGERDRAKEELHKSNLDRKLAKNSIDRKHHAKKAEAALQKAAEIETEIQQIESDHKRNQDVINSISSWDDVDKKVK